MRSREEQHVKRPIGGIIHTYQRYDPKNFPSPTQPPPDLVSGAMEHMLTYGSMRELTDEELARAVQLDPSQIAGLGPSLEALMELLRERKRKILETYETKRVKKEAASRFHDMAKSMQPPAKLEERFRQAVKEEQLYDIERLWYRVDDEQSPFARQLVQLIDRLGDKYQVDELAAKYEFTGRTPMTVPKAIEIKQELEEIDRLLKQLEEAAKTAQIGVIDMEALAEYAEPGDMEKLNELARMVEQLPQGPGRAAGAGEDRPGLPAHAQGLPALPGPAAGADLQQPAGLADRAAPGAHPGRRGGRAAADQALRIRRLAGQHGHPRLADQRHAPRRARACPCGCARKTSSSTAPATRPSAPPPCSWT